jgi:hypothetical protein
MSLLCHNPLAGVLDGYYVLLCAAAVAFAGGTDLLDS